MARGRYVGHRARRVAPKGYYTLSDAAEILKLKSNEGVMYRIKQRGMLQCLGPRPYLISEDDLDELTYRWWPTMFRLPSGKWFACVKHVAERYAYSERHLRSLIANGTISRMRLYVHWYMDLQDTELYFRKQGVRIY